MAVENSSPLGIAADAYVQVAALIVGVAVVAVLVSRNSDTAAVIQSAASGFNNGLSVAVSPVTGKATAPVLSYPNSPLSNWGSAGFPSFY